MKIEVSDDLFSELAKKLETTPENVVKVFLDHAKNLPHSVIINAVQKTSSLDTALEKLMDNAESAYLTGELIHEIIGDREYSIGDSGYDIENGTFWFLIDLFEDDVGEIDGVHLQFGDNAVISGTFSIKDVILGKNDSDLIEEINIIIEDVNYGEHVTYELDWLEENWAHIEISIFTEETLDLPKISVLEEIAKKIKLIFQKYDKRNNLK